MARMQGISGELYMQLPDGTLKSLGTVGPILTEFTVESDEPCFELSVDYNLTMPPLATWDQSASPQQYAWLGAHIPAELHLHIFRAEFYDLPPRVVLHRYATDATGRIIRCQGRDGEGIQHPATSPPRSVPLTELPPEGLLLNTQRRLAVEE